MQTVESVSKTRNVVDGSKRSLPGRCRIIAGKWRGRVISFNDAEGLRPTTDRIRETVFNWLQPYLSGSSCIDCFAGSGALGFEALSRGAESALLIDNNPHTVVALKTNAELLGSQQVIVIHDDVSRWLEKHQSNTVAVSGRDCTLSQRYDLIFLDPPFHSGMLEPCCKLLNRCGCLAENAIIYVEHAVDEQVNLPGNWSGLKQKRTGQVVYGLYEVQAT